ncbi:hypothetical protein [Kiritimatiella glycovorans]|uniref:Uncharacterized protein n=1 Tax=Kiritimatiella glycovorans TaxID=1307763 RepID=A0A0G3EFZ9_9BACT|nr:hypothetical protein [Kiritimatiella glycovorans]AKJ63750.1 hypothetical protein L21SP4_00470 [Kiritimatiella glycovorans]
MKNDSQPGPEQSEESTPDLREQLADLNLAPDWVKRDPKTPSPRKDTGGKPRRSGARKAERRPARKETRPRRERQPKRDSAKSKPTGRGGARPAPPVELPYRVTFLPDQKRLSALAQRLHRSRRAYPLAALAEKFLSDPRFYRIKLECERGGEAPPLFQCRQCGSVARSEESAVEHAVAAHFNEYYVCEEIEQPPPEGQFNCVGRCGLSGELLGPPNYHLYHRSVRELYERRFAHMSFEDYERKIEVLHDAELVDQWKQQACTTRRYRLREGAGSETAATLDRPEAEQRFREQVGPDLIRKLRRAVMPAAAMEGMTDRDLRAFLRRFDEREKNFPLSMIISLRAAFKHMKLYVFKMDGKVNYVSSIMPAALKTGKVAPDIEALIEEIGRADRCTADDLLRGDGDTDRSRSSALGWLIDKGHIIERHDGRLVLPPR